MSDVNCYVGTEAFNEAEAREVCRERFHGGDQPMVLVHMEPPTEPEELPTWVFSFWADSSEQEEGDWLHDLFDLPHLPNMPCEIA